MIICVVVWGENVYEQINKIVFDLYLKGMYGCIVDVLNVDLEIFVMIVILQQL